VPASALTEPLNRPPTPRQHRCCLCRWVKSWRDLPFCSINGQTSFPGLRPRLFLVRGVSLAGGQPHMKRSRSPCGNAQMLPCLRDLFVDYLAIPVIPARRPRATRSRCCQTLCIEAMVQDRKAIQAGTRIFLAEFSKRPVIHFSHEWRARNTLGHELGCEHAPYRDAHHAHGDATLVWPPRIAPAHACHSITPKEESRAAVLEAADKWPLRCARCAMTESHHAKSMLATRRWRENWMDQKRNPLRIEIGLATWPKGDDVLFPP